MNRWHTRCTLSLAGLAAAAFLALPQPAAAQLSGGFRGNFTTGMQNAVDLMMYLTAMTNEMQMLIDDVQALETMLQALLAAINGTQQQGQQPGAAQQPLGAFQPPGAFAQQQSGFQQPSGFSGQQGGFQMPPGMFSQGPSGASGFFGQGMRSFAPQGGGSFNLQASASVCMQMGGPSSVQAGAQASVRTSGQPGSSASGGSCGAFQQGLTQLAQATNMGNGSCPWQQNSNSQGGSNGNNSSGTGNLANNGSSGNSANGNGGPGNNGANGNGGSGNNGAIGNGAIGNNNSGSIVKSGGGKSGGTGSGGTNVNGQNNAATHLTKALNQSPTKTQPNGSATSSQRNLTKAVGNTGRTGNTGAGIATKTGTNNNRPIGVALLYRGPSHGSSAVQHTGTTSLKTGTSNRPNGVASIYRPASGQTGGAVQHSAMRTGVATTSHMAMQQSAMHGMAMQHMAMQHMAMQHTAMRSMGGTSGMHQMLSSPWSAHTTGTAHTFSTIRHR